MIDCGSQITICDLPIRLDTYKGCSHACKYCFAKKKTDISQIECDNCVKSLENFISGKRTNKTNWCDWNIPLHWGGMSDPFQPCEAKNKISLKCLELFAKTKYPFVVSTKGSLIAESPYIDLLKQCNCVVQFSIACDKYDKLELGAPKFEDRLNVIQKISKVVPRVICRIQPYMTEVFKDVMGNLQRFKDAGVYGITIEGMKFAKRKDGLVKIGGDWCYKASILKDHYQKIKDECHRIGLRFFCAENRLRAMGDDMCCCGVEGLEGFTTNKFNLAHIMNGDMQQPTEAMNKIGTGIAFLVNYQTAGVDKFLKKRSMAQMMMSSAVIKSNIKTLKGEIK